VRSNSQKGPLKNRFNNAKRTNISPFSAIQQLQQSIILSAGVAARRVILTAEVPLSRSGKK
jgi:hypothetical protein